MGNEIIAIDEAGFQLTTTYKKIWFPRGETPRGAFFWSSKKLITFGALTNMHKFYYDFYIAQNSITFMHFLRELFKTLDCKKKYVLSTDIDYQILEKIKLLEKKNLKKEDAVFVKFIRSQLEREWRKPLLKMLDRLLSKYD